MSDHKVYNDYLINFHQCVNKNHQDRPKNMKHESTKNTKIRKYENTKNMIENKFDFLIFQMCYVSNSESDKKIEKR